MAWADPGTVAPSSVASSDQANIWADDLRYLKGQTDAQTFFGVALVMTTDTSIPDNALTAIPFDAANIDVGGWWSSGTNIVVPASAIPDGATTIYVRCSGYGRYATNGTGTRGFGFFLNGSQVEQNATTSAISGDTTFVSLPEVWAEVAAGDIITAVAYQSSGGALNIIDAACHVSRLGVAS